MFDKMKQLMEMQKKAKDMKRDLESTIVNVEKLDGKVKMSFTADNVLKSINIDSELLSENKKTILENAIQDCTNEAFKKIKQLMMEKMKQSMGGLNLPGMGF
jgi:DNA-binding YbaB/EbfC family protein